MTGRADAARRRGEIGLRAEEAVAAFFEARGATVLARRLRVGRDEIDLVVRDGDVVALVEVRARSGGAFAKPLASVDRAKRARMLRAAHGYVRAHPLPRGARLRLDVVGVAFGPEGAAIEHVPGAVTGDG